MTSVLTQRAVDVMEIRHKREEFVESLSAQF